jgi:hypothetical protein
VGGVPGREIKGEDYYEIVSDGWSSEGGVKFTGNFDGNCNPSVAGRAPSSLAEIVRLALPG